MIFPGLPAKLPDQGEGSLYVTITNVRFAPTSLVLGIGAEGASPSFVEVIGVGTGESFDSDGYMMDQAIEWDSIYKTVTFAISRLHGMNELKEVTMVVDGVPYVFES